MTTVEKLEYYKTAERPDLELWVQDADGDLVDFSTGYTFEFKLGTLDGSEAAAVFTKDNGITGGAGSGTESSGTPNVTITFADGELDDIPAGRVYTWQLRATSGGLDRIYQGWIELRGILT